MMPDTWVKAERDELGQFRIIQAEHRFRSALRWLSDFDRATWVEVRMFLSSYCIPSPEFDNFLVRIRSWEREGKHPKDIRDSDGRTLEDELRLAMAEFRRGLDPLSLIGSVISPYEKGDALSYRVISDGAWLEPFAGDGGFLTITGAPRKGKTGIACLLMESWLRKDPQAIVVTNIILTRPIDRVIETPGVKTLRAAVTKAIKEGRKWLWVFDDAGLEWLKQRAMAGTSIDLEQFARIVPKHGGSLIYIDQREGGIPTTIQEFAEFRIRAFQPGFAQVRLPDLDGFIKDIPRPLTPYVSGARSAFLVDEPIRTLVEAIPRPHLEQVEIG